MTKFVLSSGGIKKTPNFKKFVGDIFDGSGSSPKVLLCFFAEPREDWEDKFMSFSKLIKESVKQRVSPEFILASQENFKQEVIDSDIIYFYGGDFELLKYRLSQYDLRKLLQNKTVAGSSSGFVIFIKTFFDSDYRKVNYGLNFIPIKTLPHFGEKISDPVRGELDWQKAEEELKKAEPTDLEISKIQAGEYQIFEVEL
jgi:peptidase E